ncbi:MAG: DUF4215 domain-containing protein [Nannocystaceae bacterium]
MLNRTRTPLLIASALVALTATPAHAAKVAVLANSGATTTATDFTAKTAGHTYTPITVANTTPSLDTLNQYDAILLFENGIFSNAKSVGDAVAAYYNQGGKCVVIGTFYWQDRSDNPKYNQPGWGALEAVDVFTGKAEGSEYAPDSMDPNSIVAHPITVGVTSLSAGSYRGGVDAKANTTVLAKWQGANKLGNADPVIGIREDPGGGKFVGISVFPDYENVGNYGADFNGDFYKIWENALSWCSKHCGDGEMAVGEECDDGNVMDGDGCSALCVLEFCGDSVVNNNDELCDDGNDDNTDECVDGCALASCGDGFVHDGVESCDDGNDVDDDECTNTCALPSCGDQIMQAGEECDDGNADNTDACLETCVSATCGDGFVQDGVEACDDGNADNTDACIDTCAAASCGDGYIQDGVESCDDGNGDDTDSCLSTCEVASCGDGFVYAGIEACDDGNTVDDDECTNDCTLPSDTTGTDSGVMTTTGGETTDSTTTTTGDETTSGTSDSSTGAVTTGDMTTGGVTTSTSTTDAMTTGDESATTGGGVDEGGCGCTSTTPEEDRQAALLALVGLGLLRRRRRG